MAKAIAGTDGAAPGHPPRCACPSIPAPSPQIPINAVAAQVQGPNGSAIRATAPLIPPRCMTPRPTGPHLYASSGAKGRAFQASQENHTSWVSVAGIVGLSNVGKSTLFNV